MLSIGQLYIEYQPSRGDAHLGDLPLIAIIGILDIVFQRLGACEFVVAGRGSTDVALACDLAGEACDGAGYW